jgi:hypothetical protein
MFQNTHYSFNLHGNQPNPSLQDKKHFFKEIFPNYVII